MKPDKVLVACPRCGHVQSEPRQAYSTACRKCSQHIRIEEVLLSAAAPAREKEPPAHYRRITCFKCQKVLAVAPTAQSTMCKHCGCHVDMHDYCISNSVAKNYRTKGRLTIEEEGFLFNTDTVVGEMVLKGRLLGKLEVERSLEIHTSAELQASFRAGQLVIPAGQLFRWPETLQLGSADIAGELVANVRAEGTVVLRATARYFGQLRAGDLMVEEGAIFTGTATIGV